MNTESSFTQIGRGLAQYSGCCFNSRSLAVSCAGVQPLPWGMEKSSLANHLPAEICFPPPVTRFVTGIIEYCLDHSGVQQQALDRLASVLSTRIRGFAIDQKPTAINGDVCRHELPPLCIFDPSTLATDSGYNVFGQ